MCDSFTSSFQARIDICHRWRPYWILSIWRPHRSPVLAVKENWNSRAWATSGSNLVLLKRFEPHIPKASDYFHNTVCNKCIPPTGISLDPWKSHHWVRPTIVLKALSSLWASCTNVNKWAERRHASNSRRGRVTVFKGANLTFAITKEGTTEPYSFLATKYTHAPCPLGDASPKAWSATPLIIL